MALTNHIVPDSPTNNFGTWNPLKKYEGSPVYSNGNLLAEDTVNDSDNVPVTCNFPRTGGRKWYTEFYFYDAFEHTNVSSGSMLFLVASDKTNSSLGVYGYAKEYIAGDGSTTYFQYRSTQNTMPYFDYGWGSNISQNYGIIGILIDYESNSIQFSANGQWGTAIFPMDSNAVISGINLSGKYNLENESLYVIVSHGGSDRFKVAMNCGQDPTFGGSKSPTTTYTDANGIGAFYYQPPTDALALCTANLPDFTPTVTGDTPQEYFKTVLYTGQTADSTFIDNGDNTWSKTGVGFQPDLVWIKAKNTNLMGHILTDAVRGVGKAIVSNSTNQEDTNSVKGYLSSFDSDGFKVTAGATDAARVNSSSYTYVAWCLKAGGNSNTFNINGTGYSTYSALQTANTSLPASSTSGMIVPSGMSINTDAGFSIVSWTGNGTNGTIPHGLGDVPKVIIAKIRSAQDNWLVYHEALGATKYLELNSSNSAGTNAGPWNNTSPTSSVFSVSSTIVWLNQDTSTYIAYCFAEIEGYSKFGSYTGNGSPDGPFVYCGFRPAFVMCKCTSDTTTTHTSWAMYDNARDSSNVMNKVLYANKSINEGYRGDGSTAATDIYIDFLSNGFKVRSITYKEEINDDGETYIYMAFAEQPFKFSNAR